MQATVGQTGRTCGAEREGGHTDLVLPLTVQFGLDEITETLRRSGVEPAALTLGDELTCQLERYGDRNGYWTGEAVRHAVSTFLAEHGNETFSDSDQED